MATYCVCRTDLMSGGGDQRADMVSLRFYDGDETAAVENGVIAELGDLEDGEREIFVATAASASSDLADCVLIDTPEVMYDERLRNLDDFINEAGNAARGYRLRNRNIFSVTAEGFVDGTVPEVGGEVGIGTGGKLDASSTGFGKCIHIETTSRYTYYAIQITKA